MSHLSDKELDQLSRDAAEQNDVEQNTSGWDRLQLRLNKEMPENQRKQRRTLFLLLSLVVLLTGSGLVYQYINGPVLPATDKSAADVKRDVPTVMNDPRTADEKQATGKINNSTTVPKQERVTPEDQSSSETGIKDKTTTETSANPRVTDNNNSSVTTTTLSTRINSNQQKANNNPGTGTDNISKNNREQNRSTPKNNQLSGKNVKGSGIVASGKNRKANFNTTTDKANQYNTVIINDPEPSPVGMVNATGITATRKPAVDRTNALKELATAETLPSATAKKNEKQAADKKFPFSIAVVGGADWTTVRFTHHDKAGYNAGVMLSWHFSKNFSLTTGALYTKKNYSAYGKDYHPPKGYWTNYITLNAVNGSCWMIDIPLNVRYDFAGGKKYSFFGSTGFSTYLMNKESYTYHYMYNGSYANRNWLNDKNSSHLFSILNLSAGYEKTVGKKVSVQIEPYLKVPLDGIGFGNMQMNSYGVNFAIRFRPEFKKQNITVPVINP